MPEPGKTMSPMLEGCRVAVPRPVGFENDLRYVALVGPGGGDAFGPAWSAAVQQDHVGMFPMDAVEGCPYGRMIAAIEPAAKGDLRALRQERFQIGAAFRTLASRAGQVSGGFPDRCSSCL